MRDDHPRPGPIAALLLAVLGFCALPSPAAEQGPGPEFPDPPHEILLLGVFHFSNPGLDSYRPEHDVNIFSERRQRELDEVLDLLEKFRPTKIAVEVEPNRQQELEEKYRKYVAGELELKSNEVHQIGFRLAKRLGHDRVWAVDADRRFYEPWVDPDEYAAEHGQEEVLEDPWPARYEALYRYEDRLKMEQTLREHLLYTGRPELIERKAGRYLIGSFGAGVGDEYPGVDSKIAWYNRNLRIFANIRRITEAENERILVVIGHGHLGILRHAARASPEYDLVEVSEVLGPGPRPDPPPSRSP